MRCQYASFCFFFFNDTATTEIYTLSLHDALPISTKKRECVAAAKEEVERALTYAPNHQLALFNLGIDRKSTRLNSSHQIISYAVFCLKKKKNSYTTDTPARNHLHACPTA